MSITRTAAVNLLNAATDAGIASFWFVENSGAREWHSIEKWANDVDSITSDELRRLRAALREAGL